MGEPINPEAWRWYFEEVGEKRCVVVDTFWQTETGGHMITNLPGCTPMKPGAASLPMFGVRPVVVDPTSGEVLAGNGVEGVLCVSQPWPGIARTIYGDHGRYPNPNPNPNQVRAALLEVLSEDNLPRFLGGKRHCPAACCPVR